MLLSHPFAHPTCKKSCTKHKKISVLKQKQIPVSPRFVCFFFFFCLGFTIPYATSRQAFKIIITQYTQDTLEKDKTVQTQHVSSAARDYNRTEWSCMSPFLSQVTAMAGRWCWDSFKSLLCKNKVWRQCLHLHRSLASVSFDQCISSLLLTRSVCDSLLQWPRLLWTCF